MTRIAIIVGSTRPGRRSERVARWVHRVASLQGRATFDIVDLARHPLPFLDEPVPAAMGSYAHDHTRRWSEVIASYDGYVFVVPEYNHSVPAVLKNAIDYLYHEWADKAAGFVSYGLQGGTRAALHLRQILAELTITVVRSRVALALRDDYVFNDPDHPESLTPRGHQEVALRRMLDEMVESAAAAPVDRGIGGKRYTLPESVAAEPPTRLPNSKANP